MSCHARCVCVGLFYYNDLAAGGHIEAQQGESEGGVAPRLRPEMSVEGAVCHLAGLDLCSSGPWV